MKNNFSKDKKGFSLSELMPLVMAFQIIAMLLILLFIVGFDFSAYVQWVDFLNLEEANIKINDIANDLDICIASGKDCGKCNQRMMDENNKPFLNASFQSPNFRYDIDEYSSGSSSCVIHAVKVNASRIPEYKLKSNTQMAYTCAGHSILRSNQMSGMDLCRDQSGNRTTYKFGKYLSP